MARDHVKVAADILNIYRHVDRGLTAVDDRDDAAFTRCCTDRLEVDDRAEHVGHIGQCHDLGLRSHRVDHGLRIQIAVHVCIDPFQHRTETFAQEVPGDDVGVVLHHGQNDLVAGLDAGHGPAVGDEIEGLGPVRDEDDLFFGGRSDEACDLGAYCFVIIGRQIGQEMQAAVNVGIFHFVCGVHRINDGLRFLSRRTIVQIDQSRIVHLSRQDREVFADRFDIVHLLGPRAAQAPAMTAFSRIISVAGTARIMAATRQTLRNPCASAIALDSNHMAMPTTMKITVGFASLRSI